MKITQSPQYYSNLRKSPPRQEKAQHESDQPSEFGLPIGPILSAGTALAIGCSMLNKGAGFHSVFETVGPTLEVVGPILNGVTVGAFSGALTGAIYGRLDGIGKPDAEPLFASIGAIITGIALGSLTGGVSAACGVTPLLAIPVTLAAGAAFSYRDYLESR